MVVPMGLNKFYGNRLPRPRFYVDVKLNPERVDPPVPVMDPLLSWAQEAHWSMGGLNFSRLRLQGRIEGSVNRLRKYREKLSQSHPSTSPNNSKETEPNWVNNGGIEKSRTRASSVSPPLAPKVGKRRKFMDLFDEESEWEDEEGEEQEEHEIKEKVVGGGKKRLARKLVGDFDGVAKEREMMNKKGKGSDLGLRSRRRGLEKEDSHVNGIGDAVMKVVEEVNRENFEGKKVNKGGKKDKIGGGESASVGVVGGTRSSPRLLAKHK